jgi:hypothetical protein
VCDSASKAEGLLMAIMCVIMGVGLTIVLFIASGATSDDGYKNAYRDSKKGTMETYVKKHYPKLWIEYNAPEVTDER